MTQQYSERALALFSDLVRFEVLTSGARPHVLITLVAALLYGQTLFFTEYTYLDDHLLIVSNQPFISDLSNIVNAFREDVFHFHQGGSYYRPILTLTFMLDAQISGPNPLMYRITNILLHMIASLLLFKFLETLQCRRLLALFLTLVFVAHPVLTQAVAWIPGRNDALLSVFMLPAFFAFRSYFLSPNAKLYFVHLLWFTLALLTKESAVVLPVLCLFFLLLNRRENFFSLGTIMFLSGWGVLIINWHLLRKGAAIMGMGDPLYIVATVVENSWIFLVYLGKILWPFALGVRPVAADLSLLPGLIAAAGLAIFVGASEKRDWRLILFGLAWYVLLLAPTLYHDVAVRNPLKFYEHRLYLPMMGLFMVFFSAEPATWLQTPRMFFRPMGVGLLAIFSFMTFDHTRTFEDSLSFAENAAKTSPSDKSNHNNIKMMLWTGMLARTASEMAGQTTDGTLNYNQYKELRRTLELAVEENPSDGEARQTLAIAYFGLGYLKSSETEFRESIRISPQSVDAMYNLGVLYSRAYSEQRAEAQWLQVLDLQPTHADAHNNLCYLYYRWKNYERSLTHCNEAMKYGAAVSSELMQEVLAGLEE